MVLSRSYDPFTSGMDGGFAVVGSWQVAARVLQFTIFLN